MGSHLTRKSLPSPPLKSLAIGLRSTAGIPVVNVVGSPPSIENVAAASVEDSDDTGVQSMRKRW